MVRVLLIGLGQYVALNKDEASKIRGDVASENGVYYVVYGDIHDLYLFLLTLKIRPHVRHSLHCVVS